MIMQYLVGVEDFAGEWVIPQGAGRAGAAVIQHLAAVLRLLLVLSLQICRSLSDTPDSDLQLNNIGQKLNSY